MRRLGGRVLAAVLVLGLGSTAGATAPPAAAAVRTDVVQGRHLRLESVADWEAAGRMRPGEAVRWDVEVSANAPEPGQVSIGVSATGDAVLRIDVRLCALPWRGEECPGGAVTLRDGWEVPRDGGTVVLARTDATAVSRLRLDVALDPRAPEDRTLGQGSRAPGQDERAPGQGAGPRSTEVRVHADGIGDSVQVGPGLPQTGATVPVFGIVGGAVLLVLGVGALLVTGARRRRRDKDEAPAGGVVADSAAAGGAATDAGAPGTGAARAEDPSGDGPADTGERT